jgi:hypothetical protein
LTNFLTRFGVGQLLVTCFDRDEEEVISGVGERKRKWFAQRRVGPCEIGGNIPDSASEKHQSDAESGEGEDFGVRDLDGRECG